MNIIEAKLMGHKTIKLGGVKFVIRKLSPAMFIDQDFFPISTINEKKEGREPITEAAATKIIQEHKDKVKDIITKGVVEIRCWFRSEPISKYIDSVMDTVELYNALFLHIVNHALNLKKNSISRSFRSIERLQLNCTN